MALMNTQGILGQEKNGWFIQKLSIISKMCPESFSNSGIWNTWCEISFKEKKVKRMQIESNIK